MTLASVAIEVVLAMGADPNLVKGAITMLMMQLPVSEGEETVN